MRLTSHQHDVIVSCFRQAFPESDHLWLFGSRVDDNKRGGDIDLYIETQLVDAGDIVRRQTDFVTSVWLQIGEQKIDVVINMLNSDTKLFIYEHARETGIILV